MMAAPLTPRLTAALGGTISFAAIALPGIALAEPPRSMAAFSDTSTAPKADSSADSSGEAAAPRSNQSMLAQVPNPSFGDVPPHHWAYPALGQLTRTYGCVAGYPDGNFRGDQAVTRNEFAAALDACLANFLTDNGSSASQLNGILADLEAMRQELGALEGTVERLSEE